MNFTDFTSRIVDIKNAPLGGLEAQFLLAPKLRLQYDEQKIAANNSKRAAVLALLYPNEQEQTTILLIQRASYIGIHSGQISFPGGKFDKKDFSLKHTALRETFEEVGIFPDSVNIFKELTNVYIPPSNFLATPFLGFVDCKPNFILNHEVSKIIEILHSDLMDEKNITSVILDTSYMKKAEVPCFKIQDCIIWGATAMMLSEIKELFRY